MKKTFYLLMPVMVFFFLSCDKDDPVSSEATHLIANISFAQTSSDNNSQTISVTIEHSETCWVVSNIEEAVSGKTINYNIKTTRVGEVCGQAITPEVVTVIFNPSSTGEYTLNFLVNGNLRETRKVTI